MTASKLEPQPNETSGDINNDISKTLNKTPPNDLQKLDHAMPAVRTYSRRVLSQPEPIVASRPSRLVPRPSPLAPRPSPVSIVPLATRHSSLAPLPHLDRPLPLAPLPSLTP